MITKGQMINERYQIIRMIGEGGMANVYLAKDVILDREVAVKVLRGDLADDEKFVRRFQREAISSSSLSHPNIVEMYDVGEDDGKYFIVMEYLEGRTLKSLLKRRNKLIIPEVIDIMLQLTSGLAHAHSSYIIHRDIKPQNIMIREDGTVKITDFGIAMALNSNELTQTNSVMGSVHYLPPEQANGAGATIKSDIYSLGILMYELLVGKVPFKGDNAVEIAIKQMKEQIPSVIQINDEIPQSIENIILKACAKNPKNRYDNIMEMHSDLENCLKEDKIKESRFVYKYSEHELDETKVMPNLKSVSREKTSEDGIINIIIWVLAGLSILIILGFGLFALIFPKVTKLKDIKVPDVSNLTLAEAKSKLKEAGFEIASDIKEKTSDTVDEGKVIMTSPSKNEMVKEGKEVIIYISTGEESITLEDYTGEDYRVVKGKLEVLGLKILIEKEETEDRDSVNEGEILRQEPLAETKLKIGDAVTLYIPDIATEYPDFTNGEWQVSEILNFGEENEININIEYIYSEEAVEGTILSQDRAEGTDVVKGAKIKISVATNTPIGDM